MKVKELIEYLKKMPPDVDVEITTPGTALKTEIVDVRYSGMYNVAVIDLK